MEIAGFEVTAFEITAFEVTAPRRVHRSRNPDELGRENGRLRQDRSRPCRGGSAPHLPR